MKAAVCKITMPLPTIYAKTCFPSVDLRQYGRLCAPRINITLRDPLTKWLPWPASDLSIQARSHFIWHSTTHRPLKWVLIIQTIRDMVD